MMRSMLWLGQAAQKSFTTWMFAFSLAVCSAASARLCMPTTAARPSPAVVSEDRRVMPEDGKTLLDFKVLSSLDDRIGSRRCRSHNSNDTPRLCLSLAYSLGIDCEQFFAARAGSRSRRRCGSVGIGAALR